MLPSPPQGWGTFTQTSKEKSQHERIEIKWGKLRLKTLAFEVPEGRHVERVELSAAGQPVEAAFAQEGKRVTITLGRETHLGEAQASTRCCSECVGFEVWRFSTADIIPVGKVMGLESNKSSG